MYSTAEPILSTKGFPLIKHALNIELATGLSSKTASESLKAIKIETLNNKLEGEGETYWDVYLYRSRCKEKRRENEEHREQPQC